MVYVYKQVSKKQVGYKQFVLNSITKQLKLASKNHSGSYLFPKGSGEKNNEIQRVKD